MKALIVDDELINRVLLSRYLTDFFEADVCENAKEAMDKFSLALEEGQPYDLLCLGIMMPDVNGKELLTKIRDYEEKKGILGKDGVKVIMATALSDANEIMDSFRAGCES